MGKKDRILASGMTKKLLEKSFNFALDFHLDPKKTQANRTTGQTRGLGGVIDSFLVGKIVESCVVEILEKFNRKKYELDFQVHDAGDRDPDIIAISERGVRRAPKIFVEIKNIEDRDRWIGLTEEQFQTVAKNEIVGRQLDKIFIIYATIKNKSESNGKWDDLLGVFLKSTTDSKLYGRFTDLKNLYVEIKLVLTAKELSEVGTRFEKGYYFYETEIFEEADPKIKDSPKLRKMKTANNILPKFRRDKSYPYPQKFGDISFRGKIEVYHKQNDKSNRMFVYCLTDVKVFNKVIGSFSLSKGKLYEYKPGTVGRNPVLNRNNLWIAKRNAENVLKKTVSQRIQEIADSI